MDMGSQPSSRPRHNSSGGEEAVYGLASGSKAASKIDHNDLPMTVGWVAVRCSLARDPHFARLLDVKSLREGHLARAPSVY